MTRASGGDAEGPVGDPVGHPPGDLTGTTTAAPARGGAPLGVPPLLTFGHGTADRDRIVDLLHGAGVRRLVDVRRFPGSRRHPHVARDELARWLPEAAVEYRWEPRLGGRRHVPAEQAASEPDTWWQVDAFRAYAAHTRSAEFGEAMAELLAVVRGPGSGLTAVMCSETVWWRCHRRLISDVAVLLHDVAVEHLGHDGRRTPHPPATGARVTAAGLVYDRVDDGPSGRPAPPSTRPPDRDRADPPRA